MYLPKTSSQSIFVQNLCSVEYIALKKASFPRILWKNAIFATVVFFFWDSQTDRIIEVNFVPEFEENNDFP